MTSIDRGSPQAFPLSGHPSDGVLLALHDGETGGEVQSARRHLETCAHCQARMDVMQRGAAAFRRSLSTIPIPPLDVERARRRIVDRSSVRSKPTRPRSSRVAIVLLVGGAVAAAAATIPLRRWAAARAERAPATGSSTTTVLPAAPTTSSATISFDVVGQRLTVTFDSAPAGGVLSVERGDVHAVSVRTTSPAGADAPPMVVLPAELIVRSSANSHSSYEITVPREIVGFKVVIGGRTIYDGAPMTRIPLGR